MYKLSKISQKAYKKCEIEIIDKGKYFRINRKYLGTESGYKKLTVIFDKCDPEKQKYRYELMADTKFQPCRRFVRNDLVERKIRSRRLASIFRIQRKVRIRP